MTLQIHRVRLVINIDQLQIDREYLKDTGEWRSVILIKPTKIWPTKPSRSISILNDSIMISAEMSPTKQITGSCNSVWICKLSLVMTSSLSTNHLRPYPGQKKLTGQVFPGSWLHRSQWCAAGPSCRVSKDVSCSALPDQATGTWIDQNDRLFWSQRHPIKVWAIC